MYRGFDLKIDEYPKYKNEGFYSAGNKIFSAHKSAVKGALENLVLKDGSLDGFKMQAQWFPQVDADIFLSHSHKNEETAICLAGYLYEKFDIKCFIDSTVWNYSNELLRQIDNKYCKRPEGRNYDYDYDLRNLSTSHVHLMLSGALAKMIDSTECVFFLNTPDSIKPDEVLDSTISPWIYSEILTTQVVRKRLPNEHLRRRQRLTKAFSHGGQLGTVNESFITHKVELGHLTRIDIEQPFLDWWLEEAKEESFKLDALYKMFPEKDEPILG